MKTSGSLHNWTARLAAFVWFTLLHILYMLTFFFGPNYFFFWKRCRVTPLHPHSLRYWLHRRSHCNQDQHNDQPNCTKKRGLNNFYHGIRLFLSIFEAEALLLNFFFVFTQFVGLGLSGRVSGEIWFLKKRQNESTWGQLCLSLLSIMVRVRCKM